MTGWLWLARVAFKADPDACVPVFCQDGARNADAINGTGLASAGSGKRGMNAASMKTALVRLGGWGALAGVTALLTLLFSILGNLSCAVLAGMILGAGRRWQWEAVPLSLVFPAVLLSLSHFSKVELPPSKLWLVALVSMGAFWAVLGLMFVFRSQEKREESPPPAAGSLPGPTGIQSTLPPPLDLAAFRGSWTSEENGAGGSGRVRMLHIEQGRFKLAERNLRGRERVLAQGEVRVEMGGPVRLVLSGPAKPMDGDQAR